MAGKDHNAWIESERQKELQFHQEELARLQAEPEILLTEETLFEYTMRQGLLTYHRVGVKFLSDPSNPWVPITEEELEQKMREKGIFICCSQEPNV